MAACTVSKSFSQKSGHTRPNYGLKFMLIFHFPHQWEKNSSFRVVQTTTTVKCPCWHLDNLLLSRWKTADISCKRISVLPHISGSHCCSPILPPDERYPVGQWQHFKYKSWHMTAYIHLRVFSPLSRWLCSRLKNQVSFFPVVVSSSNQWMVEKTWHIRVIWIEWVFAAQPRSQT